MHLTGGMAGASTSWVSGMLSVTSYVPSSETIKLPNVKDVVHETKYGGTYL
jgi:hypothetical protein